MAAVHSPALAQGRHHCIYMQVRLLSQSRHELLRRVPDGLADVFRIGSTAPGQPRAPVVSQYEPEVSHTSLCYTSLSNSMCGAFSVSSKETVLSRREPAQLCFVSSADKPADAQRCCDATPDYAAQEHCCTMHGSSLTSRMRRRTRACAASCTHCQRLWPPAWTQRRLSWRSPARLPS